MGTRAQQQTIMYIKQSYIDLNIYLKIAKKNHKIIVMGRMPNAYPKESDACQHPKKNTLKWIHIKGKYT